MTHSTCVASCPKDYNEIANRCLKKSGDPTIPHDDINPGELLQTIASDMANSWFSIIMMCVVALVFSYVLLMLFRHAIKYVIWVIYIGLLVVLVLGSIALLILYVAASNSKDPQEKQAGTMLLVGSGIMALFALIFGLILFFFRKRIELVASLFKEASKALVDVPLIVFEPLLTFLALAITFILFIYFALVIESSGSLEVKNDQRGNFLKAEYVKNGFMSVAHYANLIAFLWFTAFIFGCQNFVIASTVSQWFFTRTKSKLDSPISRAFSHLLNFHLGSVCLGSLLITLIKIIRMIVESLKVRLSSLKL
jgi:solute carrier family 44 (choline transporter-like protein), member 1